VSRGPVSTPRLQLLSLAKLENCSGVVLGVLVVKNNAE
jgi:hypothetical protein